MQCDSVLVVVVDALQYVDLACVRPNNVPVHLCVRTEQPVCRPRSTRRSRHMADVGNQEAFVPALLAFEADAGAAIGVLRCVIDAYEDGLGV